MENYVLAQAWTRANIQDSLWYAMANADINTLKQEAPVSFGDKVYVITTKKIYIMGNDGNWYEM